jgi:hypothetical protein
LSQQSALAVHAAPSAAHVGWSHVPLVHEALQQSLLDWHALPDAAHAALPH